MQRSKESTVRPLQRLAGALLMFGLAGTSAAACRHISTAAELSSYTLAEGAQATVTKNICYAEGTQWKEQAPHGEYDVALYQQFDLHRPAAPLSQKLPLIIWAHPNGLNEDLEPLDDLYRKLVEPALKLGFAFMSIEFRHPVASQMYGKDPILDIPNTDIARAVQWARHRSGALGIDGSNIFLLGQSRGTLDLMNALSKNLADEASTIPYQTRSSRVRAVYAVQAQTTYEKGQTRDTFIHPDSRGAFENRYPDFQQPGSAINEITTDDPPITLRNERAPTNPDAVIPLNLPAQNGSCADLQGCFDIHHPNFGLKLHLAFKALYQGMPPASKFDIAYNVPTEFLFVDQATNRPYACFFVKNLTLTALANVGPEIKAACGL